MNNLVLLKMVNVIETFLTLSTFEALWAAPLFLIEENTQKFCSKEMLVKRESNQNLSTHQSLSAQLLTVYDYYSSSKLEGQCAPVGVV